MRQGGRAECCSSARGIAAGFTGCLIRLEEGDEVSSSRRAGIVSWAMGVAQNHSAWTCSRLPPHRFRRFRARIGAAAGRG